MSSEANFDSRLVHYSARARAQWWQLALNVLWRKIEQPALFLVLEPQSCA